MSTPERSAALGRALASDIEGLPADFARQVATLAEARAAARSTLLTAVAMLGAFAAMIGVCMVGWLRFGKPEVGSVEWFDPFVQATGSQPWLLIGVLGFVIVQMLTFRRRALT
jgi:hypothetical protein